MCVAPELQQHVERGFSCIFDIGLAKKVNKMEGILYGFYTQTNFTKQNKKTTHLLIFISIQKKKKHTKVEIVRYRNK